MYQNEQLRLLINIYGESMPQKLLDIINNIKGIYDAYNNNYGRYTDNYISMMESAFNQLKIEGFIPKSRGGTSYSENPLDGERIIEYVADYYNKLYSLRYLNFLSEEKKTVVFVGPNGCGKTTLLRNLINATGEDKIGYYPADRLLVINETYNPERDNTTFLKSYKNADKFASDINNQTQTLYIVQQINQAIALFEKKRAQEMDLCMANKLQLKDSYTEKILRLWNELVKDRTLFSEGTLRVETLDGKEYPIKLLSSGEKSIFYFLVCIFLKEKNRIILLTSLRITLIQLSSLSYGILLKNTAQEVYLSI